MRNLETKLDDATDDQDAVDEPHFTPREIAKTLKVSENLIREIFMNEPGVWTYTKAKPHTRSYRTMRIPKSVYRRVKDRDTRLNPKAPRT